MVDPSGMHWTDQGWRGVESIDGQVLYELHVGTFTPEGTWDAARGQLPHLKDLGVTVLEVMPAAEFQGAFGWGYDGVFLFAPFHGYGTPDDFRRFVDRAHAEGLAVILDVVYNHLGPGGDIIKQFSDEFFSDRHKTEWGEALNFDGPGCGPVREFVLANVDYWIDEFHLDGMRIDGTQGLFDTGPDHILGSIAARMREAAGDRRVLVVGESEPQHARLLRGAKCGGLGFDMLWSDDFHHAARVAATGRREGYYGDYLGSPQELVSVLKRGWLYQGQWDLRQGKRRGKPAFDIPPPAFISYLQNHDQVANSARGERLHELTTPGPPPRRDGPATARSRHADALPGPGVRGVESVPVFQRPGARNGRGATPRPQEVPLSVPQPGDARDAGSAAPSRPPRDRSNARSSTRPSARRARMPRCCCSIATCCGSAARMPRSVAAPCDGAVLGPEAPGAALVRSERATATTA